MAAKINALCCLCQMILKKRPLRLKENYFMISPIQRCIDG